MRENGNSMAKETPEYATVAEVAARARVSKMTIYRMINDGTLPAARLGRSFRVRSAAVDEWLRQSEEA